MYQHATAAFTRCGNSTRMTQMSIHLRQREVEGVQTSQQPGAPHLAPELAFLVAVAVTAAPHTPQLTLADTQQHEHSSGKVVFIFFS